MIYMLFLKKKELFVNFSQIVAAIYHNMEHLTGFKGMYASKWRISKFKRRLIQKDFEFSSVVTIQQVLFKQQFQYSINISAFCYFW